MPNDPNPSKQQFPITERDRVIPMAYSAPSPPAQSGVSTLWTLLIIGGVAGGCIVSMMVAVAILIYRNSTQDKVALPRPMSDLELHEQSQEAFNNYDIDTDPTVGMSQDNIAKYRSFEQFLMEFEQASQKNDSAWLRNAIDADLLMARIGEDKDAKKWDFFTLRVLRDRVATFEPDHSYYLTPIKLEKMEPTEEYYVAYAFGYDENKSSQVEWRFWLSYHANTWKLIDWERLDIGLSQSEEYKIRLRYSESPAMKRFNDFVDKVNLSDKRAASGNDDGAIVALQNANPAGAPPELKEYAWLLLCYRWIALGQWDNALEATDRVDPIDRFPGAYSARATIYREFGKLDQALENVLLYESAIGLTPQMSQTKAEILASLGRNEESLAAYRALLRQQKADPELLMAMVDVAPEAIQSDLIPWLKQQPQPLETATEIASDGRYETRAYELMSALDGFVREQSPESASAAWIAGCVAEIDDDLDTAAEQFRLAMQLASDANRNDFADDFLSVMVALGKIEEGYAAMPDKKSAFDSLVWQREDGEIVGTDEQWSAVIAQHRQQFPNDAGAAAASISQLLDREQWAEAKSEIQAALQQFNKSPAADASSTTLDEEEIQTESSEDLDYYISDWQSKLLDLQTRETTAVVVYETTWKSGLKNAQDMRDVFRQLAATLAGDMNWSDLNLLIDKHREIDANDPMLAYYESEVAADRNEWGSAYRLLTAVRPTLAGDGYLTYIFDSKIVNAACRTTNWLDYYRSSADKPKTFEALADELSRQANLGLSELISEHQLNAIDDPEFLVWMSNYSWENQELPQFLDWSRRLLNSSQSNRDWRIQQIMKNRQSALVKAQLYQDARDEFAEDPQSTLLVEALIAAEQGNHTQAATLALQHAEVAQSANGLYSAPKFGWVWFRPEYRELQHNFPPRLDSISAVPQFLALLREPMEVEIAQVEQAAVRAFGRGAKVTKANFADQLQRSNLYLVHDGSKDSQVWYVQQIELSNLAKIWTQHLPKEYQESLELVGSCLLISRPPISSPVSFLEREIPNSELAPALRMLEDLGRTRIAAWYSAHHDTAVRPDPSWAFQTSTNPNQIIHNLGQSVYLPNLESPLSPAQRQTLSRELRKHLLREPTNKIIEVQARLQVGWLEEFLWLEIENAERVGRDIALRGKLLSTSILAPNITAGTICEFNLSEAIDWRWKDEASK